MGKILSPSRLLLASFALERYYDDPQARPDFLYHGQLMVIFILTQAL